MGVREKPPVQACGCAGGCAVVVRSCTQQYGLCNVYSCKSVIPSSCRWMWDASLSLLAGRGGGGGGGY